MAYSQDTIQRLEKRWQDKWQQFGLMQFDPEASRKYYVLDMFPYPSGAGLHVGHPLGYVATDILARFKRMQGYSVLHPMGFDAFGLPAENYAIQTGQHPAVTTEQNIRRYQEQLRMLGLVYTPGSDVRTSDPGYYRWTQWIFLQLFSSWFDTTLQKARPITELEAHFAQHGNTGITAATTREEVFTAAQWQALDATGREAILQQYRLAYQSEAMVNWCPALGTVLANEEVKDGFSERGGHPVIRKPMRQWSLRITAYAQRLLDGLDTVRWPESIKEMQRNWLGRSQGASIRFALQSGKEEIEVFTTRPDTLWGVTYLALAPEHPLVAHITTPAQQGEVQAYVERSAARSERDRLADVKTVSGCFTGAYATHPFTGEAIPVWIADYVLVGYGTGAVMAVPAHDSRDHRFARHFNLPIRKVIATDVDVAREAYEGKTGTVTDSGFITGLPVQEAIARVCAEAEAQGIGRAQITWRIRDAIFSRQRYWGEPIPIIYRNGIPTPVPEDQLPVTLPEVQSYKPTGTGESPLAAVTDWVNLPDGSQRETDTMPGWAGSSWYFMRYLDPANTRVFAEKSRLQNWLPVDLYLGGAEHAVGHLLYARFWTHFLHDLGHSPVTEPFTHLVNQGMIQGVSALAYKIKDEDIFISSELVENDSNDDRIYNKDRCILTHIDIQFINNDSSEDAYLDIENFAFNFLNVKDEDRSKIESKQKNLYDSTKFTFSFEGKTVSFIGSDAKISRHSKLFNISKTGSNYLVSQIKSNILQESNDELLEKFRSIIHKTIANSISRFFSEHFSSFRVKRETEKMSKSLLNVVNPDDICREYGADTFRLYEMFLGPLEQHKPWSTQGISGVFNFLRRAWNLVMDEQDTCRLTDETPTPEELKALHQTLKKTQEDIERLSFNTAVSQFMICTNELTRLGCHKRQILLPFLQCLAPFAPHFVEELWQQAGQPESIFLSSFPHFNEAYLAESSFEYPVSVNGKLRFKLELPLDLNQHQVTERVLQTDDIRKYLNGGQPKKVIVVPGKIVNVVV
ncbi:MAG: leucine--tRNA ligase [Bacteroidetes bacterium]|nr:leucine--tRNA ligase [Bacteroidota bacterium]